MSKSRITYIISLVILGVVLVFVFLRPIETAEKHSDVSRESQIQAENVWILQFDISNHEGEGKNYTIDGGHRMDAIKDWIKHNNENKIIIPVQLYPPLTEEQRRIVYNKYNIPIRQTRDDYIFTYKDTIPIYTELINKLPVTVYGKEREHVKVAHMCSSYIGAKATGDFDGSYSDTPKEFTEAIQALDMDDLDNMIEFWEIISSSFRIRKGEELTKHRVIKTTPFAVLFRLWYQNKDRFAKQEIIDRFSALRYKQLNGKPLIDEWASRTGKGQSRLAFGDIKRRLNTGYPADQRFKDA